MKKTKLAKKESEEMNRKEHFYSFLKSAEEQSEVEGGIKFNLQLLISLYPLRTLSSSRL